MKLEDINKQEYKLYVDMDGVVADFEAGITKLLGEPHDESQYEADSKYRSKMWKAVAKYKGELWYELPPMSDAFELWNYVKRYNPEMLTATGNPQYNAGPQKLRWIKEKFGNVKVNITRKATEKAQYACPQCILIDDKMKAIGPWREAGGIGILHTSAANTINELKKLGL